MQTKDKKFKKKKKLEDILYWKVFEWRSANLWRRYQNYGFEK